MAYRGVRHGFLQARKRLLVFQDGRLGIVHRRLQLPQRGALLAFLFAVFGNRGFGGAFIHGVRRRGPVALFQIIVEIADVFGNAVLGHHHHALGEPVDKIAVVADGEDHAGEIRKRFFQHLAAVHVQVVGGFVQQQEVIFPEHQLGQRHAPALPARQRGDLAERVVPREQELPQRASYAALLHHGKRIPHFVQHRVVQVQVLLVLIVIADIHVHAEAHGAAVRRFLAV